MAKSRKKSKSELRKIRTQQIIFVVIGLIVILSMVLALVAR